MRIIQISKTINEHLYILYSKHTDFVFSKKFSFLLTEEHPLPFSVNKYLLRAMYTGTSHLFPCIKGFHDN
jgi:hypothetical protein